MRTRTLKSIIVIAVLVSCAVWLATASADNGTPISYHNGPVMAGTSDVYVIWYGNWSAATGPNSLDTQIIVTNFMSEIGGSIHFQSNATYPGVNGFPSGGLLFGGSEISSSYTHGLELDAAAIQGIVSENIGQSHFLYDPKGIYLVVASSDVGSSATGFCTPNTPPHHGSFFYGGGQQALYAFIGNPARCPSVAAPQFFAPDGSQLATPNGNLAADAMASSIVHVLDATVTDPFRTGWFDDLGLENADKCQGSFSHTRTLANGARVNFTANGHNYLIQDNWINNFGGYCGQQNDAPPRADNQTVQVIQDIPKSITLTAVDDNGDPVSFIIVTPPQHGALAGSGANRTYTPASGFYGADSFTFKANDGTLDSTLATVSINVNANTALDGFDPNANGLVRTAVIQPDGKILIGGDFTTLAPNGRPPVTRNYIARLNIDGTVDPTFNPSANSSVQAITLQPDGKILVGGDFSAFAPNGGASITRSCIARVNANGTIDATFDPRPNNSVHAVVVQADGGIVIGGDFTGLTAGGGSPVTRNHIARLNANGTIDTNFNPDANGAVDALAVQPDGRLVMGGKFTKLAFNVSTIDRRYAARLNVDGTVDVSFDPNADSIVGAVAIQPDGKVLLGGAFTALGPNDGTPIARNHLARMNVNGTLDTTFNPSPNGFVRTIVLQPDGKILIGGGFNSLAPNGAVSVLHKYIARLNQDGTLAPGVNPAPNDQIFTIAVQHDGKIVCGGAFLSSNSFGGQARNRIARLETDGRVDQTLNLNLIGDDILATAVQADGKILIGGDFTSVLGLQRNNLARLNTDGTVDTTLAPIVNDSVRAIAVQADGKILVGGPFSGLAPNGGPTITRNNVARINTDGSIDSAFNPNLNNSLNAIAVQADGKILLGGFFTALAPNGGPSVTRGYLVRLNTDGTLDAAFNPRPDDYVSAIAVQSDGKILVGGQFTAFSPNGGANIPRNKIARLNPDGSVDPVFDPNADSRVQTVAVQPNGKILLGGFFSTLAPFGGASVTRSGFARLNTDGTVENAFNPNPDGVVSTIGLQADGKILIGGSFNSVAPNGGPAQARKSIARLNPDGTLDAFDPQANNSVLAVALQPDGKILVGGTFDSIGGQTRRLFARLANDTPVIQNLTVTQTSVTWSRSAAAPELWRVIFEQSTDGINYSFLGNGARVGTTSDFTLAGQTLAAQQNLYIRARGIYRGGDQTASESITESVRGVFLPPPLHLAFAQQPTDAPETVAITPPVTVRILDASNNLVNSTAAVTVGIGTNPSSGTLSGTKTVSAVNGTATFNNLSIDKLGAGYTLNASGTDFISATSSAFNVTVNAPSNIVATSGANQAATITAGFANSLQAKVTDANGNAVSAVVVTFSAPPTGASGTFANGATTTNATTDANGMATVTVFANAAAGSYVVSASINGGSPSTGFSLTNLKASQAINITTHAPAGATYNSQFNVVAVSSSGLPVAFSSSGACTNNGATFTMTTGTGACTVKYDQAGDANHSAAAAINETVMANKAAQTITLDSIADKVFGDADFAINASASSGLSVSLATSGACTLAGLNLHLTGAGTCAINASQTGDANYNAAADVQRSFQIGKAAQTITFAALADRTFGEADFTVSASSSSGLPIGFEASGQCSNAGAMVHINGAGGCTITASQPGDTDHEPAPAVARSFQIAKAATTTQLSYSMESGTLAATVTSPAGTPGGTVTFKSDGVTIAGCGAIDLTSGLSSCAGSSITTGLHTFSADYSGDANFNASTGEVTGGQAGSAFEFDRDRYLVAERGGAVTIVVKRSGDVSSPASVDYVTDDGSISSVAIPCAVVTGIARERCDYTRAGGTLEFAANETEKSFVVLVNDDSYTEGQETISLKLSNPRGGAGLGSQATATVQIADDLIEPADNAVDDDANFVRQHYHDFLNREPDTEGFRFWINNIALCDDDGCGERKRVDTSAAFYLSIEFQETGYLAERFYKVAYGDATGGSTLGDRHQLPVPAIRLREFLHDTQEIGQGVVVNQPNWRQQLESRKQVFAREFVSRDRFRNAYPDSLAAEEFIRRLNANVGEVLTDVEMVELQTIFGGANASSADDAKRAQAVRALAENQVLQQREFNRAFVLMQYFGYLRRNPDDAQDSDYSGYEFWLRKLEQFGGDYTRAEMVKAFIDSTEYRQRFGQ